MRKLEELEQKLEEIKRMNDFDLTDYQHDLKQLFDAAREETDRRLHALLPELGMDQIKAMPPSSRMVLLKKLGTNLFPSYRFGD